MKKISVAISSGLIACIIFGHYTIHKRIGQESRRIQTTLNKSRIVYNKKREEAYRHKFEEFLKSRQALEAYQKLIKNLDGESISTVNRILTKIQKVAKGKYDIYTPEEIDAIKKLRSEFKPVKLGNSCYAYRQYLIPIDHFIVSVFYCGHFIDKLTTLDDIKNKDIIDVGAYIGDSAIVFSDYTNKKVYSFEPTKDHYANMLKTLQLNSEKKNIVPVKLGLGKEKGKQEIKGLGSVGASTKEFEDRKDMLSETIEVTTLDDFVKEHKLNVGLIKVDIKGAEQDFLEGAENTIKTQKPTLLISIYHNPEDFFHIKTIIESWNLGYKFRIIRPKDTCILNDTMLIAEPPVN